MAVNAANSILSDADRQSIELLVVASESGVDFEKPISTWVQRYAALNPNCRNFEIKHACYGSTAATQLACHWLASDFDRGAKALVISTDQSRMHLNKPWEFVLGAGAAAVLLSNEPKILEIEVGKNGYWTNEISDLTRPTGRIETGNSETSLVSYLEALEGAFAHFVKRVPEANEYDSFFQRHVYHMPFGGIAWRAHKTLLRLSKDWTTRDAWANFASKSLASLRHVRRMGATYSASTFIGLLGLIDGTPDLQTEERVSVFSYGSGCCAEFYSGKIVTGAEAAASESSVAGRLDARRVVSVKEYENIELQRTEWVDCGDYCIPLDSLDGWYDRYYRGKHLLVFQGMTDFCRQYTWS
jgi:hydroxymethylglutaryl-CoA synthase